ncbi:MAG: EthD family reductase, partial [Mesorhizobium sp.]
MARLIALYRTPKDPAAFERYYFSTHVPLAQKIPGLRKYDVSNGNALGPEGPSNFHMVATLYFDSLDAIKTALNSP